MAGLLLNPVDLPPLRLPYCLEGGQRSSRLRADSRGKVKATSAAACGLPAQETTSRSPLTTFQQPENQTAASSSRNLDQPSVTSVTTSEALPPVAPRVRSVAGPRPPVIIGSRKLTNSRLAAACIQKKTSIFVSKLDGGVSSEILLEYMQTTFGVNENFTIVEQTVRSGDYKSFRVEARVELLKQLLSASNWPENVLVKKFRFPRSTFPVSRQSDSNRQSGCQLSERQDIALQR